MAYSADTFVADEQPTTAKWNKLWTNDASFNDGTGIATGAITAAKISGFDYSLATTNSNPYKFSGYRNAAQNMGNGVFAIFNSDTELFDTNSNFDTSIGRYTAPVSGFYIFQIRFSGSLAASSQCLSAIYKNGSILRRGSHFISAAGTCAAQLFELVQVTAADYFDSYTFGSGGALEVSSADTKPSFEGILQSRT